uniref:Transmembrane channel-like protein n=1 Tax=Lepisosteus oculatus TaxID=7918 RepID=W5N4L4_LEPOC|nr:PREDICTED: transmembrane channel-like protein 8 [Lepisosteus oculatus]
MEETRHRNVEFFRLESGESAATSLYDEPTSYHQTAVFTQLPSSQSLRRRRGESGHAGPAGWEEEEGDRATAGFLKPREWDPNTPLRMLPLSMEQKRNTRKQRQEKQRNIGCWESWQQSQRTSRRRLRESLANKLRDLQPWKAVLHQIEGKFGSGVMSYFTFLRCLVYLNLLNVLVITGMVIVPITVYERNSTVRQREATCKLNDSFLDLFSGMGFLGRSSLFYGFYTRRSLDSACLNIPLLFLLSVGVVLLVNLVWVVVRTVNGYKLKWMMGNRYKMTKSYKIFCGWDFCIQVPDSAALRHSNIRNDLKVDLEEERFLQRESQRTVQQWVLLYFMRAVLNLVVFVLLSGAFYLIYFATQRSQRYQQAKSGWILNLFMEYLPSITITLINFLLPFIFCKIVKFEDYSVANKVNITLVRSIFLKLASLAMFLFFMYQSVRTAQQNSKSPTCEKQCWENTIGQEMYKLLVFDFLASLGNTILVAYPRKQLVERCSWRLVQMIGKDQFLIPLNVLDIVYSQTVSWVGLFFCPLLPLLNLVKMLALFYIRKFHLFRNCAPVRRMFRASSSSVLFYFMLLLGLLMSLAALGIHFVEFKPSRACGPFQEQERVLDVATVCIQSLPNATRPVLLYLVSEAFAIPLILTEIILLTFYMSIYRANCKTIERLKDRLVMEGYDKRFLVNKLSAPLQKYERRLRTDISKGSDSEDIHSWQGVTDLQDFEPVLSRGVSVESEEDEGRSLAVMSTQNDT